MEEKRMIDFNDAFERQAPPSGEALEREQERLTREYRAAKAWMTGAKGWSQKAEKRERARQACARFAL